MTGQSPHPSKPDRTADVASERRLDRLKREAFDPVTIGVKFTVPRWIPWSAFVAVLLIFVSYYTLDLPLTVELHDIPRWLKQLTEYVTELGKSTWYFIGLPVVVIAAWLLGRRRFALYALHMLASVAAAGLLATLLKIIFGRYRPGEYFAEGEWGFTFFAVGYDLNSFPSGHSAVIGAVAMTLLLGLPRLWPAWLTLALVVGFTRVLTGSHWLSDVIAGLYLGAVTAYGVRTLLRDRGWYPASRPQAKSE